MRGLEIVQFVDLHGPVSISDIAREFQVDKGSISRLVAAAEIDGWLERRPSGIVVGPRSALLGDTTPAARALRDAEPLIEAVSGATGLVTQALALSGDRAVGLAISGPASKNVEAYMRRPKFPLFASASGKVIAAQLSSAELDRLLPPDPFPDKDVAVPEWSDPEMHGALIEGKPALDDTTRGTRVFTRADLDDQLQGIRQTGAFREYGEMNDALGCIAFVWPHYGTPASLAVVGNLEEIEAAHELIERTLRAATARSATRDDVIRAAAGTSAG
jgi:DNA-binding IclR family transcriptional regulator